MALRARLKQLKHLEQLKQLQTKAQVSAAGLHQACVSPGCRQGPAYNAQPITCQCKR